MLANLHRRLREHGSFKENGIGFRRPKELRDVVEENVVQYFCDNPHANTGAEVSDLGIRNHFDVWHVFKDNYEYLNVPGKPFC